MTFEDDLLRWRLAEHAAMSVLHPSHHATLRADTVNDMNETPAEETSANPNSLAAVRATVAQSFEKAAAAQGVEVSDVVGQTVINLLTYVALRRAAKRGDIARTVLYTGFMVRNSIRVAARLNRVAAERTAAAARGQNMVMNVKGYEGVTVTPPSSGYGRPRA